MGSEEEPGKFAVPREDTPMDMSLSEEERLRRTAFYKKKEELKASSQEVMDCSQCLMLFNDRILYGAHMMMHTIGPTPSWQCSICKRQCADRRQFQQHIIKYAHSRVPPGIVLPPGITFTNGLPDLMSLLQPSPLLERLIEMIKNETRKE